MWIQGTVILAFFVAAHAIPAPKPTPVSVYQQHLTEEQQDYQPQLRQPVQYKQQLVQQVRPAIRPTYKAQPVQNPNGLQQTESEDYETEPPQPYQFSFDVNDDENTNYQNRKEQREGNKISGSYSVVDSDGFIRTVTYTADPVEGFKAHVSREPTNIVVKVPTPQPSTDSQPNYYGSSQKVQYTPAQSKQIGIQYNGAPVPRQQVIRPQQTLVSSAAKPQPQYAQDPQTLLRFQPVYQGQSSLRHAQAVPVQYLAETSQQSAQYNDGHLRGR